MAKQHSKLKYSLKKNLASTLDSARLNTDRQAPALSFLCLPPLLSFSLTLTHTRVLKRESGNQTECVKISNGKISNLGKVVDPAPWLLGPLTPLCLTRDQSSSV